jgi:hypothetical protein
MNAHDVGFLHDQKVFAVELDFGAGPLAEQHAVAGLDVESDELACIVTNAGADGEISPSCGFSLAVSGMMMPPLVFASDSTRRTTTRSCSGRKFNLAIVANLLIVRNWEPDIRQR